MWAGASFPYHFAYSIKPQIFCCFVKIPFFVFEISSFKLYNEGEGKLCFFEKNYTSSVIVNFLPGRNLPLDLSAEDANIGFDQF